MDIAPYVLALKTLFEATDLSAHVDALTKYATARVIVDRVLKQINDLQEENKPQMADYIAGRLLSFICNLEWAVMPVPDSYKSAREWFEVARQDLLVAEMKMRRE